MKQFFVDIFISKYLLFFSLFFSGCASEPAISFDAEAWRNDKMGCKSVRLEIYQELIDHKNEILGRKSTAIVNILGSPERNELYKRNQKFFVYQVTPGSRCISRHKQTTPLFLIIRFNALDLSSEVYISDKGSPVL